MSEEKKQAAYYVIDADTIKKDMRDAAFVSLIEQGYRPGCHIVMGGEDNNGKLEQKIGLLMFPPVVPGSEQLDLILGGQKMILGYQEKQLKYLERLGSIVIGCLILGIVIGLMILGYLIHVW
jgi:hypothetical protein